jgi:hypothetical protein
LTKLGVHALNSSEVLLALPRTVTELVPTGWALAVVMTPSDGSAHQK